MPDIRLRPLCRIVGPLGGRGSGVQTPPSPRVYRVGWMVTAVCVVLVWPVLAQARGNAVEPPTHDAEQVRPSAGASDQKSVPKAQAVQVPKAKTKAGQPAVEPTKPKPGRTELSALVLSVRGGVHRSAAGVAADADKGWVPVREGDRLSAGTQVRTGLRSAVELRFGDGTYVQIQRATFASIAEFYRSANAETIHLDLGYGTIRGGSTEGRLRSELVVDSPVATLSKEGTEGWQISVEPQTRRFVISLARTGLVQAIAKLDRGRTVRRHVRPGEYANQDNIASMWLHQAVFDRAVKFYRAEGVSAADAGFSANNTTGLSFIAPGGGMQLAQFAGRDRPPGVSGTRPPRGLADLLAGALPRPEGDFGVAASNR